MRWSAILAVFLCCGPVMAQEVTTLGDWEDKLAALAPAILNGGNDSVRYAANGEFLELLKTVLHRDGAFRYPFEELKTIAILSPADRSFRLFNWNLPRDDGTYEYFGFIQYYNKKFKEYRLFELKDGSGEIQGDDQKIRTAADWYGAHYYTLISPRKRKNKYYTLLGWDGNSGLSNKKIIEVLSFGKAGQPVFGKDVLGTPLGFKNRVVFEYNERAAMSLKYYPEDKTIVYDHLSGNSETLSGVAAYQGPDGSYDALVFKRGKWQYIKDYDARNVKEKKKSPFNDPG